MTTTLHDVLAPRDAGDEEGGAASFLAGQSEVLSYLEEQVVASAWQDVVCGDSVCEEPLEFPALGEAGCAADCGRQRPDTTLLIYVRANFTVPGRSATELRDLARWNLCRRDAGRASVGLPDACWFSVSQRFRSVWDSSVERYDVPGGDWCAPCSAIPLSFCCPQRCCFHPPLTRPPRPSSPARYIRITGDDFGAVSGRVYELQDGQQSELPTSVSPWPVHV